MRKIAVFLILVLFMLSCGVLLYEPSVMVDLDKKYPLNDIVIAQVSSFGEPFDADPRLNSQNFSHGPNLLLDANGILHFAFSDGGQIYYAASKTSGRSWSLQAVDTLPLAMKASKVHLAVTARGPVILAWHDLFNLDGNGGADTPANFSRELFEIYFDGINWNSAGIKSAWGWQSDALGYASFAGDGNEVPGALLAHDYKNRHLLLGFQERGPSLYGSFLHLLTRAGKWNSGYSVQDFLSDGEMISNTTTIHPDGKAQELFSLLWRPNGDLFALYNFLYDDPALPVNQIYYRYKPKGGTWSAPLLLASDRVGLSATLDEMGQVHLVYRGGLAPYQLYYMALGSGEMQVHSDLSTNMIYSADIMVESKGRVNLAWDITGTGLQYGSFGEIYYAVKLPKRAWGAAVMLTSGYSGFGRTSPSFVRGSQGNVWPLKRQLVYCENYLELGVDKKRIILYTFAN